MITSNFYWIKRGLIFKPSGEFGWMNTHAQIPTILKLNDKLRIFFGTRTVKTESKVAFMDLDIRDPSNILFINNKPVLNNGEDGTFDEHGIMPSSIMEHEGIVYLYYSGWSRRCGVPYNNLTGLALSNDGGNGFKKVGQGPILSQKINEPFSATSPYVFLENNKWHMFYCSGTLWLKIHNKYEHVYNIKYASSDDGIEWKQPGKVLIHSNHSLEAITRPTVIKIDGLYHMWFCYRGSEDFREGKDAYRIGYAWSDDLETWHREDNKAGIEVSEEGWDSEMICYPHIVKVNDKYLMFYNGNGFGKSGFGYAELEY